MSDTITERSFFPTTAIEQTGSEEPSKSRSHKIRNTSAILLAITTAGVGSWFVRDTQANSRESDLEQSISLLKKEKSVILALQQSGFTHVVDVRPNSTNKDKLVAVVSSDTSNPNACEVALDIKGDPNTPQLIFNPTDAEGKSLIIDPNTRAASDRSDEERMITKIFGLIDPTNC